MKYIMNDAINNEINSLIDNNDNEINYAMNNNMIIKMKIKCNA